MVIIAIIGHVGKMAFGWIPRPRGRTKQGGQQDELTAMEGSILYDLDWPSAVAGRERAGAVCAHLVADRDDGLC